ncbi:hypothetical protein N657DRAFT_51330 [Parathielavia appendiculata]|uniref:Uncharacterized protein n=1 Tax=Parathielavia appendiculata TaxID=2587402 RepID=A0AAN6Z7W9_9PEZI|nr:hypothetical protein N657DRAFT_51330 [Parathielavia appendiculata]
MIAWLRQLASTTTSSTFHSPGPPGGQTPLPHSHPPSQRQPDRQPWHYTGCPSPGKHSLVSVSLPPVIETLVAGEFRLHLGRRTRLPWSNLRIACCWMSRFQGPVRCADRGDTGKTGARPGLDSRRRLRRGIQGRGQPG